MFLSKIGRFGPKVDIGGLFSILTQYATFGTVETHAKISPIDVPLGGGPNRSTSSDLPEFLLVPICS